MSTKTIDESLFGRIRRQLLCLFFLNPLRSYYLLELVEILKTGRGGVQRELANLFESGIITRERAGMKVLFSLSQECPVKDEMQRLLGKLVDFEDILLLILQDYAEYIRTAVISTDETGEISAPADLLISFDGSYETFMSDIARIELLTGFKVLLKTMQPSKIKEYIRTDPDAQWVSDGRWKLLVGSTKDLTPDLPEQESAVSEPDLFSGTDFNW